MKKRTTLLTSSLVIIFLFTMNSSTIAIETQVKGNECTSISKDNYPTLPISSNYIPHAHIVIDNDDDFITLGFNGTGTSIDPYLIEGYNITAVGYDSAIEISDTTKYFEIRDCFLVGWGFYDVLITDISDGTATIKDNQFGIPIGGLEVGNGLGLENANGVTITNNTFDFGRIELGESNGVTIINNTLKYGAYTEDIFIYNSNNTLITENNILSSFPGGIRVESSYGTTITENYIHETHGIRLYDSHTTSITNNQITVTGGAAVQISQLTTGLTISNNEFHNGGIEISGPSLRKFLHLR